MEINGMVTSKKSSQGFTLIELLVAISVLAIMLVVGVPSFANLIDSNKLRTTRDLLVTSIHRAQQRSSSTNVPVYLCPSANGTICDNAWSSGNGWLLYEDLDRDTAISTGEVFSVQNGIKANSIESDVAPVLVLFSATGHATISSFRVCSAIDGQEDLQITLSRSGRITYDASGDLCH
jgi:prepilin-type N-terminal cleavage/methylation domain-containing protein